MKAFLARGAPGGRGLPFATLWLVLALALALRLANCAWGSLKLDDFHSLHHARAVDLATFFEVLARDNHPPVHFLMVRAVRAACGESPWALRLPALLCGLGTLAVLWRLGARLASPPARTAAVFLLAVSSLHLELSSDVRMYALLALCSAGLLEGLLALLEDGRGAWRITLWTALGLHAHYHFLYSLAVLGASALALVLTQPVYRPRLGRLCAAFALAGLLAAPWYALGFPAQLAHGLAPGGSNATLQRLFEGYKNLVFLNVSVGGGVLRLVGLAASALLLLVAASGGLALLARGRREGRPALAVLALAAAVGVPLLTYAVAQLSARAGYEWRYLVGALPAFSLVVGAEASAEGRLARVRRACVPALGACALVFAALNARDPGEEDYHGAIAWITAEAGPADGLVAADWQPFLFPHSIAWSYYAPRLAGGRALPTLLPYTDDFSLAEPGALAGRERVLCCFRSLPNTCAILRTLRATFAHEEIRVFGRSIYVHVFTRG